METRTLRCKSCKGYANVTGTFNGNETYNCKSCGALNQVSSKSGKPMHRVAIVMGIVMFILGLKEGLLVAAGAGVFVYFIVIILGKAVDWIQSS